MNDFYGASQSCWGKLAQFYQKIMDMMSKRMQRECKRNYKSMMMQIILYYLCLKMALCGPFFHCFSKTTSTIIVYFNSPDVFEFVWSFIVSLRFSEMSEVTDIINLPLGLELYKLHLIRMERCQRVVRLYSSVDS